MKIRVKTVVEKEASDIRITVPVRYEENDMPNGYPHRSGEMWSIVVDVESGQIRDWPTNIQPRSLYMKVCDEGAYYLLGPDGSVLAAIESDYVVRCIPQEYGDYLNFKIDETGRITNWKAHCTPGSIEAAFFND